MGHRRRDRWSLGPALTLPEAARGGPDYDVDPPDPVLAWVQFPDRALEVEAQFIAYTERAVLVEWGFGQAKECAWVWRDAVSSASSRPAPAPSPYSSPAQDRGE